MYDKGKLIRKYRKELNWTQEKLASKVNTSVSTISKIESGKYQPSAELMLKIQKVLQMKELIHQEYHPLFSQLTSWQQSITQRNYAEANKYYNELKKFPITYYYDQKGLLSLCNFLHALIVERTDLASNYLEKIQKYAEVLSPTNNYPYIKAIGFYYLLLDHLSDALRYFRDATNVNPEMLERDGEIHLYYAYAYEKIGNNLDSVFHGFTALTIFQSTFNQPNTLLSRLILIKNAIDSQNKPIAKIIQELHNILTNYTSIHKNYIYYVLSIAYLQNKDYNNALRYCKNAMNNEKIPMKKAKYIFFIAYIYALLQNPQMSLNYIEGAKKMKKGKKYEYSFYLLKGIIQQVHGNEDYRRKITDEIIPYFELTGNLLEKNYCHAILGNVFYEKKSYKDAANHFYINPGNFYIRELLAKYPQK